MLIGGLLECGCVVDGAFGGCFDIYYNDKESAGGTDNKAADAVASSSSWVMNAN